MIPAADAPARLAHPSGETAHGVGFSAWACPRGNAAVTRLTSRCCRHCTLVPVTRRTNAHVFARARAPDLGWLGRAARRRQSFGRPEKQPLDQPPRRSPRRPLVQPRIGDNHSCRRAQLTRSRACARELWRKSQRASASQRRSRAGHEARQKRPTNMLITIAAIVACVSVAVLPAAAEIRRMIADRDNPTRLLKIPTRRSQVAGAKRSV